MQLFHEFHVGFIGSFFLFGIFQGFPAGNDAKGALFIGQNPEDHEKSQSKPECNGNITGRNKYNNEKKEGTQPSTL